MKLQSYVWRGLSLALLLTLLLGGKGMDQRAVRAAGFAPSTHEAENMLPADGHEVFVDEQIGVITLYGADLRGSEVDRAEALLVNRQQDCEGKVLAISDKSATLQFDCRWDDFVGKNEILLTSADGVTKFHFSLAPIYADGIAPGLLPAGYRVHH